MRTGRRNKELTMIILIIILSIILTHPLLRYAVLFIRGARITTMRQVVKMFILTTYVAGLVMPSWLLTIQTAINYIKGNKSNYEEDTNEEVSS